MQELRIEFLINWLDYLEAHGFDPAELESGEWARFLKFSGHKTENIGANLTQKYISFIGGAVSWLITFIHLEILFINTFFGWKAFGWKD